ncbi:SpoIIE family protein phosphatase [Amycolatopsis sp. NBC_01307]|uniref:SpoIIE family protein phosphatase n=1 Tax=Amycolatopsis sp. NBC_01307 TaxID=2903561 RepID=UPI002E13BF16|nr:SpoIIE family protein phosphatase [Amycolatopsis sp. NBC_01307]
MTTAGSLPVTEDFAWLRVEDETAHGRARRAAATLAGQLGFGEVRVAEIGLAVTELATNLTKHAVEGVVVVRSVRGVSEAAVEVVAIDRGPGMADAVAAGQDGESTAGTLGIGMGAVRRLADVASVLSEPGHGTVVTARFHPKRGPLAEIPETGFAGITRPIGGEEVCGDAYAVHHEPGRLRLMMCDGSGHGPLAAAASRAAADVFREHATEPPEAVVKHIHEALRRTRGGAVAVADVDTAAGTVRFAGLGNIAGCVVAGGRKQGMISAPGVAGHQARTIRAFDYPLPPGSTVVLHSDGLTERWSVDGRERLFAATPLAIAAALLRDAGIRHDDAGVLVGKPRP